MRPCLAVALALAARPAAGSRVKHKLGDAVSGAQCPPTQTPFRSIGEASEGPCGSSLKGRLTFALVNATGLPDGDTWSKNDAYGYFRIIDVATKQPLVDYQESKIINNDDSPSWEQFWTYDFLCPQAPSGGELDYYTLEVSIWDSDSLSDDKLGEVKLPLEQYLKGDFKGYDTLTLDTSGDVGVIVQFCPNDATDCQDDVRDTLRENGVTGVPEAVRKMSCEMDCFDMFEEGSGELHRALDNVNDFLQGAASKYDSAQSACDRADGYLDDITTLQNTLLSEEDEERIKQLTDSVSSTKARMQSDRTRCETYRNQSDDSWASGINALESLDIVNLGKKHCSQSAVLQELLSWVSQTYREKAAPTCYCQEGAVDFVQAVNVAKDRVKQLSSCVEQKWWAGSPIVKDSTVSTECAEYFNQRGDAAEM